MVLRRGFLGVLAFAAALSGAPPAATARPEAISQTVDITLEQRPGGAWRLVYANLPAAGRVDLGAERDAARLREWRVTTPGVRLISDRGRTYLARSSTGREAWTATIEIARSLRASQDGYETQTPLGADGAVLYTGHFIPFAAEDARMPAVLTVRPLAGARVAAFGADAAGLERWRSPYLHPAFIYVGPASFRPTRPDGANAIIDPAAPAWASEEAQRLVVRIMDWFETALGERLDRRPDMFLARGDSAAAGRLSYSGDALPAQFLITLDGGGWESPDRAGLALLREATAHEVAHLWLMKLRPANARVGGWIHEGGAEALAAEAVRGLGLAGAAETETALRAVRAECARLLDGRSLRVARGAASYPCGHALIAAAARAHNREGSVALFWRDFSARAMRAGGYDEALFITVLEEAAGAEIARAFSAFTYMAYAAPDRELARLHALAVRAAPSLEPRSGR